MTSQEGRSLAWRDIDVMLLALCTLVGVVAWIAASVGVRHVDTVNAEIAWTNLGVVGLIVFGSGNALWLLRGRRAVGARRVALVRLESGSHERSARVVDQAPSTAPSAEPAGLVQVHGSRLAHRATCPLVVAKQVEPVDAARMSGTAPCGVCSP
jgi:hypothetical protein